MFDLYCPVFFTNEPMCDKTNKVTGAPSQDSDQPGYLFSLIRSFSVCSVGSFESIRFLQADSIPRGAT